MDKNELRHVGILGMKWGHRMARDGSVTTVKRGKRVPLMKSHRGKAVQVNGRALSNATRAASKKVSKKLGENFDKSLEQKYNTNRAKIKQKVGSFLKKNKLDTFPVDQFLQNVNSARNVAFVAGVTYVATVGAIRLSKYLIDGH